MAAFGGIQIKGKEISFTGDIEIDPQKETLELRFVEIDVNLTLSDLSSQIPHGDEFSIKEVKFYPPYGRKNPGRVEATTRPFGVDNRIYFFNVGKYDHIFAIDVTGKLECQTGKKFSLSTLAGTAGMPPGFSTALQANLD